jgi:hypothetical protein
MHWRELLPSLSWLAILVCLEDAHGIPQSRLAVRLVMERPHYCLGQPGGPNVEHQPADAVTLRLTLHTYYRNTGKQPLIVPHFDRFRVVASLSVQDGNLGQPEWTVTQSPDRHGVRITDLSPTAPYFEVLQPDEETHIGETQWIVLQVHAPSAGNSRTGLLGRSIFFRVDIDHNMLERGLASRWKTFGDLWTGKLTTVPLEVQIPQVPEIANCDREFRID